MGTLDDLLSMDAAQQQQQALQDSQDADESQQAYALAGGAVDPRYQDVPSAGGNSEAAQNAMHTADLLRGQVEKGYAGIEATQQKQANAVRDAIRAARQRLLAKPPSTAPVWFNIAKALGAPTQTGTFGEGVSNLAGSLEQGSTALQKERDQRDQELDKYNTVLAQYGEDPDAIDNNLTNTKLGLLKLQMQQAGALDVAATRSGGRGSGVSGTLASRLAAEANDPTLPEPQRKAAAAYLAKLTRPPRDPNAVVELTDDDKTVMDHVGTYDESLASALSRMSSEKRLAAQAYLYQAHPGYTEQSYPVVKQALHDITSQAPNAPGGRLSAFGGMLPHLELILNLSKALQGGNVKAINNAKAAMATYFGGDPRAVNLQSAVQLWAPEIERAIGAGQGSETEKIAYRTLITQASKPDVVASQVGNVFLPMTASKIDNILSGFYGSLPAEQQERYRGYPEKRLSKEARRILLRRGLLQDYLWDQGDLGDISPTRGTITRNSGMGPPKIAPTTAPGGAPPAAPASKGISPKAKSYLDQVGQ